VAAWVAVTPVMSRAAVATTATKDLIFDIEFSYLMFRNAGKVSANKNPKICVLSKLIAKTFESLSFLTTDAKPLFLNLKKP
jgi:hypothetical protein